MGEFIVMAVAALLLVPVTALVLSIVALVRLGRLEKRLAALRGGVAENVPAPAGTPPPPPPPPPTPRPAPEPAAPRPAVPPPPPRAPRPPLIHWENFTAVKLMSWIGGFTLFLGAVFFAKYSIDNGWLTPVMRVGAGFVLGAVAVLLGLKLHGRYDVTGQTLAAAGAASLYAVCFSAHALYGFLGPIETFGFLTLVTVLSFLLAARMNSRYIAVLALLGGFLVPPLVSTGVDRPLGLFGYITLLNVGLWALVARKGWGFLWFLAAGGTALVMAGWWNKFPGLANVNVAAGVCLWFTAFFAAAQFRLEKLGKDDRWTGHAAGALPLFALLMAGALLGRFGRDLPSTAFPMAALFGADAATAFLALRRPAGHRYYTAAGILLFLILFSWTENNLTAATLPAALAAYLLVGGMHGALALVFERRGAPKGSRWVSQLFPAALLLPLTAGLLSDLTVSVFVWPVLFGLNLIALGVAVATGFFAVALAALVLTFFSIYAWIPRLSAGGLAELLVVVGAMGLVFAGAGLWWARRSARAQLPSAESPRGWPAESRFLFPALAGALPHILLATAAGRLRPADPSALFGVTALVSALLLGISGFAGRSVAAVALVALGGAGFVQYAWQVAAFAPPAIWPTLAWTTAFALGFLLVPFLGGARFARNRFVWMGAALSGPVHFFLYHHAFSAVDPAGRWGLLPAAWAAVSLIALVGAFRRLPGDFPHRQSLLALFGAVALFFITLIFPLQFDKEWLTLAWALEGVALLWLYRRIPHPGLKTWAFGLVAVAFARLALNPAIFDYHPRVGARFFNWYLYAYGATALCAFLAARLWPAAPSPGRWERRAPGLLAALGTGLLFLLLNIEIADFFSEGAALTFNLRGSLAQDLAYTLGWGLFGLGLIVTGLVRRLKTAQWSGLALLGVTIGKLYLHDVWRLTTLFRSAAFAGLAVMLILGSFLFQHYQARAKEASRE
ncbi:MAG: DUF2339 domain-containing protein [Elusimicrobia bacterium]|nr:DUF2339 domain-containing protein [Elusimicrobiota bacterium]